MSDGGLFPVPSVGVPEAARVSPVIEALYDGADLGPAAPALRALALRAAADLDSMPLGARLAGIHLRSLGEALRLAGLTNSRPPGRPKADDDDDGQEDTDHHVDELRNIRAARRATAAAESE